MLAVTTLCKNRAWILPHFLACLARLDWPTEDMALVLVDDGSTDTTRTLLTDWVNAHKARYAHAQVLGVEPAESFGDIESSRIPSHRMELYSYLAGLRNAMIESCQAVKADYQLSIDSDVLFTPDLARALVRHQLPYVSALVINDNSRQFYNGNYAEWRDRWCNIGRFTHETAFEPIHNYPMRSLVQVGMSGACYLADRRVLDSAAAYDAHEYGEDAWYAIQLRDRGIPIYCDTTPRTVHVMEREHLDIGLEALRRMMS